jgi:hypothetical protein
LAEATSGVGSRVFDTSAPAGTQLNLPLVGSFTIPDLPGCQTTSYP